MSNDEKRERQPRTGEQFRRWYHMGATKYYEEVNSGRLKITKLGKKHLILPEDEDAYVQLLRDETAAGQ